MIKITCESMDIVVLTALVVHIPVNDLVALRCTSTDLMCMFDSCDVLGELTRAHKIGAITFKEFVMKYDETTLDEVRSPKLLVRDDCITMAIKANSELGCRVMSKVLDPVDAWGYARVALETKSLHAVKYLLPLLVEELSQKNDMEDWMYDEVWGLTLATLASCDKDIIEYAHEALSDVDVYEDMLSHEETLVLAMGYPYALGYMSGDWSVYDAAKVIYGDVINPMYCAFFIRNEGFLIKLVKDKRLTRAQVEDEYEREYLDWEEGLEIALQIAV